MIAEIPSTEDDPTEPVTRGEFNEAMQAVNSAFEKVATKDDLKALEERMATKDDVEALRIATREDFKSFGNRVDERFDELFDKIESYINNRIVDIGGMSSDEAVMIREAQERHEERITTLEAKQF